MPSINFMSGWRSEPKQPVSVDLVSSGLVCHLDPLKWPSVPKMCRTCEIRNKSDGAAVASLDKLTFCKYTIPQSWLGRFDVGPSGLWSHRQFYGRFRCPRKSSGRPRLPILHFWPRETLKEADHRRLKARPWAACQPLWRTGVWGCSQSQTRTLS